MHYIIDKLFELLVKNAGSDIQDRILDLVRELVDSAEIKKINIYRIFQLMNSGKLN